MDYEKNKLWLQEHKKDIATGICFIVIFFVGFGSGKLVKQDSIPKPSNYGNYNIGDSKKTTANKAATKAVINETPPSPTESASTTISALSKVNCVVKGNISSGGKKIYHVPSGSLYKIVKPEICFATEREALAQGFVKSGR